MATIYWPGLRASPQLLVPRQARLQAMAQTIASGPAIGGAEQSIGNTPGRWKLTLSEIPLATPLAINTWTQIERTLQGRSNTVGMPVYEYTRAPWPLHPITGRPLTLVSQLAALNKAYPGNPLLEGVDFSGWTDVIQAVSVGDTPAGAMSITIEVTFGAALKGWETFGYSEKVYGISAITGTGLISGFPTYTCNVWPPVRTDIPNGSALEFDDPVLRCRLETDDGMALKDGLDLHRFALASVTMVEDY